MKDNTINKPPVLGKSLQIGDGDLQFIAGDLTMVSGYANFHQGMKVMIETPLGTDIFNVNYGFDLLNSISQPKSISLIEELIRLNIVKSLSLDNRVREIREIAFDDEPRFFELNPQENFADRRRIRKGTRSWQATAIVQTIAEEEVSVTLSGVGLVL